MPRFFIACKDKYVYWSTVVDAPISNTLTLARVEKLLEIKSSSPELEGLLHKALKLLKQTGCSRADFSKDQCYAFNRAGACGEVATEEEVYERYDIATVNGDNIYEAIERAAVEPCKEAHN